MRLGKTRLVCRIAFPKLSQNRIEDFVKVSVGLASWLKSI